jgi:hypothetical protein
VLAGQVIEAITTIRESGLVHEHARNAFTDREGEPAPLAGETLGCLFEESGAVGIQRAAEELKQLGTNHARYSRRLQARTTGGIVGIWCREGGAKHGRNRNGREQSRPSRMRRIIRQITWRG